MNPLSSEGFPEALYRGVFAKPLLASQDPCTEKALQSLYTEKVFTEKDGFVKALGDLYSHIGTFWSFMWRRLCKAPRGSNTQEALKSFYQSQFYGILRDFGQQYAT